MMEKMKYKFRNGKVISYYYDGHIHLDEEFDENEHPRGNGGQFRSKNFNGGMDDYKGNIDLSNRPQVKDADGYINTVRSMSFNYQGKEILIPTVSDDDNPRIMSDEEAMDYYYFNHLKKGTQPRILGEFNTPEEANKYAQRLHEKQEEFYDLGDK